MRTFIIIFALAGLVMGTGCANTATGFGKDLEKSGQAIQSTVTKKKTTASNNNAGSNVNSGAIYETQPQQQQTQEPTPLYNNGQPGYQTTPSGY